MQKLLRIKTANDALYIGRLLPKNPKKRKKRENRNISLQDKKITILIAVRRKKFKKRKFITRANKKKRKKTG